MRAERWRRRALAAGLAAVFAGGACSGDDDVTGPVDGGEPVAAEVAIPGCYGIHDTYVRDGLAFVSAWNSGMMIYDVGHGIKGGSVEAPALVSRTVVGGDDNCGGLAATHNAWWFHNGQTGEQRYLFVGQEGPGVVGKTSSGDIYVLDVSDLENPVLVSQYHLDGAGTHNFWIDEANAVLYAAYYNGGVVAIDISGQLPGDLTAREIDRIRPGDANTYVWGVMQHEGSLYAADMVSGFYQLRLSNGTLEHLAGGDNAPEYFTSDLWVHGEYAYTGTWGFREKQGNVVNVWHLLANGAPVLVRTVTVAEVSTVSDVEVSSDGQYLLATTEHGTEPGLYVFSLTDPATPKYEGRHLVPQGLHTGTFAEIGGRLYVFAARNPGAGGPALMIFDVEALGR